MVYRILSILFVLFLAACSTSSTSDNSETPPDTEKITPSAAARFLTQATFGPTTESIEHLVAIGYDAWLTEQMAEPVNLHLPEVQKYPETEDLWQDMRYEVWWRMAITAEDQLRQRIAFALSEIFVVSDKSPLGDDTYGMANYYDILVRNAFGNYRELLGEVTLSPMMGIYLSMLGNEKPDEERNIRPDENYAREIMQLFSIGLVKLNVDGSVQTDSLGQPVSTYNQDVIKGFAHVFTGWNFADNRYWYDWEYNGLDPMRSFEAFHDKGAKYLLNSVLLPAGQTARADLEAALDTIFYHPNIGPFIAKQLIQSLVTSNPSAAYIERAARVFNDNGQGVRGDLAALARAILRDSEARADLAEQDSFFGKLKEPMLRFTQLWRAFNARAATGKYWFDYSDYIAGQAPLSAPSVFNFFSPGYSPPGAIAGAGLVAPEFQIFTETYATRILNMLAYSTLWGYMGIEDAEENQILLDISTELALVDNPAVLLEHLNLLLLSGQMSVEMEGELQRAIEQMPAEMRREKVTNAIFLIVASPQFAIQK